MEDRTHKAVEILNVWKALAATMLGDLLHNPKSPSPLTKAKQEELQQLADDFDAHFRAGVVVHVTAADRSCLYEVLTLSGALPRVYVVPVLGRNSIGLHDVNDPRVVSLG